MEANSPLLEREEELAAFERVLREAREGRGGTLMVEGEAGAGKTSLLDAATQLGSERKARVLRARGGEYERDFTYGVVRQLFEPLFADRERSAELLKGTAAAAAPIFARDAGAEVERDPFAVQHGLYWLVADLAEIAPLVLVVDDAQWADLASLRALAYIARRLDGLPAVLVVAVRTGEPGAHESLLNELRLESGAEAIAPRPLTEKSVSEMVDEELGQPPSAQFAAACCRASGGNPFLIVELLRALAAEDVAPSDENADRLVEVAAAGVARSILIRLSRLGEFAVGAARAVAILEPNAEPEHVAALAGLSAEESARACARLIEARLLEDGRPLGFVHPLVRSAVYADMPEPQRALLHGKAARRLAAAGSPVDSIAAHLLLAPPAAEPFVVETLRAAAREAGGRGAPESAAELLRRARAEPPPPGERFAVEHELGLAQLQAADVTGVETLLALRASSDDCVVRAEIAAILAISMTYRGRGSETEELLDRSVAELDGSHPRLELWLRAELLELSLWGREGVPEWLDRAVDSNPWMDSFEGRRVLEIASFLEAIGLGTIERAEGLADRTIVDSERFREDATAGFPPIRAWIALVLADRGEEAERFHDLAMDIARTRNMNAVAAISGMRALSRILDGDLTRAQPDAAMAFEISLALDLPPFSATWRVALIWALLQMGELDTADEIAREIPDGGLERGLHGALKHCVRGELRSARGEHEAARDDFLEASLRTAWLPLANPEVLGWRTGLASAEAALGNRDEALRLADEAVRVAHEAGGQRGIGVALRARGAIAGTEGIDSLREAAKILAGTRSRLHCAHAFVDLGAALRRANRRKEAREPLREGLDLAHACGAAALEERARTELAATGARPRHAVLSGVDSLTPSELRVAGMAAEGMTNREIAQQLYVTSKTVETHLRHVYQKLGIGGRAELPARIQPAAHAATASPG